MDEIIFIAKIEDTFLKISINNKKMAELIFLLGQNSLSVLFLNENSGILARLDNKSAQKDSDLSRRLDLHPLSLRMNFILNVYLLCLGIFANTKSVSV